MNTGQFWKSTPRWPTFPGFPINVGHNCDQDFDVIFSKALVRQKSALQIHYCNQGMSSIRLNGSIESDGSALVPAPGSLPLGGVIRFMIQVERRIFWQNRLLPALIPPVPAVFFEKFPYASIQDANPHGVPLSPRRVFPSGNGVGLHSIDSLVTELSPSFFILVRTVFLIRTDLPKWITGSMPEKIHFLIAGKLTFSSCAACSAVKRLSSINWLLKMNWQVPLSQFKVDYNHRYLSSSSSLTLVNKQ